MSISETEELNNLKQTILDLSPEVFSETAKIVKRALLYVLDGEEHLDDLEGCEKTQLGIKIEKYWLTHFSLPKKITSNKVKRLHAEGVIVNNPSLDTEIAGIDVDIKHSIGTSWMIPQEAFGKWCLLFSTHFEEQTYSLGLLKMSPENLTLKGNRDTKLSVSANGRKNINWLARHVPLDTDL